MTEARLVAQALSGAQPAFEQIVRRYQRPVINFIARVTGDRAGAEDLAQETFVKAFRALHSFDTTRRFSSWLLRIAHNTAVDALRRTRGHELSLDSRGDPDRLVPEPAAPPQPDLVEQQDLGRALDAALRRLRPEYRAAVVLRYHESLSFDEISAVMQVPEATARTYVHRARKELAGLMTAAGWDVPR
ncbi:MAG: RNA polymerase sigma factor [Acidobacteriota bacterium]